MRYKFRFFIGALLLMGLALAACGPSQEELDGTATAVAVSILNTQTAEAPPPTNTATPEPPTATPTPTDTPTPTPTVTQTFTPTPDLTGTAAVEATEAMDTLLAVIDEDLQLAGLSTDQGRLAWLGGEPVTMLLENYSTHNWLPLGDGPFSDFVLRADVTWESTSGLALCGFWFRGESLDIDSEHYTFEAIRLSGLPGWSVLYWNNNFIQSNLTGNIRTSPEINQESFSTNEWLFVAEGNLLSIWVNGESLGSVTINRLRDGYSTFYIRQESGTTTCTFSNAWIWDISEQ